MTTIEGVLAALEHIATADSALTKYQQTTTLKPKCITCGSSDFLEPDPNMYMTIALDDGGHATGYGCVRCSNPIKAARPALCTCGTGNDPDAWDYHAFDCAKKG